MHATKKALYDLFIAQECVNHLEIAGDKCLILPGRYHEEVIINNKFATKEKPFVIEGAFDFDDVASVQPTISRGIEE